MKLVTQGWLRRARGALTAAGSTAAAVLLLASLPSAPALATTYQLTGADDVMVGDDQTVTTVYEDTLYDIANKFSVGSEELIRVNPGIDPWLPGAGKKVIIPGRYILPPGPHEGIIVNLPEHRLYYFPKPRRGHPRVVYTYPVSIGKMDWHTPLGLTHVIAKIRNPTWYPPASVRKEHLADGDPLPPTVPPGPDNPLGAFAMRLAVGNGTYLIHGTNNPLAIGMPVTHGCIRMYPQDVAQLFPMVPVGTPVRLVNQPIKVAWVDGQLWLEAHPPVDDQGQSFEPNVDRFSELLRAAVGDSTVAIDWDYAHQILQKADGILATVGLQADLSGLNDSEPAAGASGAPAAPPVTQGAGAAAPARAPASAATAAEATRPQTQAPSGVTPSGSAAAPSAVAPSRAVAASSRAATAADGGSP